MCGIFALFNNFVIKKDRVYSGFLKGSGRGPENTAYEEDFQLRYSIGFHRLAINGLNEESNQPLLVNGVKLICNGEIYNSRELLHMMNVEPRTDSDCEVIIHLYLKYGIHQTIALLDGVFAFVLIDEQKAFVGRDAYGVRPLFEQHLESGIFFPQEAFIYASEMKQMVFCDEPKISQVLPGTFIEFALDKNDNWYKKSTTRYTTFPFSTMKLCNSKDSGYEKIFRKIRSYLRTAVKKRVEMTDRPIACLLSGGLDSSLITSLVCQVANRQIETYSIGLPGSEDLKYAKMVSKFLKTKHTEIIVSENDFFNAIPQVIKTIESYDTTTVRASVGNYLVAKYISRHSDAKVIFNGDGSDELTGGYLYFGYCPDSIEFDSECKRLLRNIHCFDVLRSDRCISAHGLEARTPFLDKEFVEMYLSIPSEYRFNFFNEKNERKLPEKYLLRKAFDNKQTLPDEVLWRTKEAFSDGVSSYKKSWAEVITEKIEENQETYDLAC